MHKGKWKTLKQAKLVWANDWVKVQASEVQLPTGVRTKFFALNAPDGVALLALDDHKRAVLNFQFRPALNKVILELPAGQLNKGEDRKQAAQRELAEESGLRVKRLKYLGRFYRNPARDTGSVHIYFGRVAGLEPARHERYEHLETVRIPWEKLLRQVLHNEIQDVTTIFAVLMLQSRLAKGEIKL